MFVFVFVFIAISFIVTTAAAAVMAKEVFAKAKTAKGMMKGEVPVIILQGEAAHAGFVQTVDPVPLSLKSVVGLPFVPFIRGGQRELVVLALAAKLVARKQGWQYFIAMPSQIGKAAYLQVKAELPQVTPRLIWEALLAHELYHAHCFLERGMKGWPSVYHLYKEEVQAYTLQFRMLGHDVESEQIDTAIMRFASHSVEISGARTYLPEYV